MSVTLVLVCHPMPKERVKGIILSDEQVVLLYVVAFRRAMAEEGEPALDIDWQILVDVFDHLSNCGRILRGRSSVL